MRLRRIMTLVVATTAALMLFAGTAFAHFCYVPNRSERGNAAAAKSQGWVPLDEILLEGFGLCEEGVAHFAEAYLAPRGISRSTLIHTRTLAAGGRFGTEQASDGKGVDHLFSSEQDLEDLDQALEGAFEICFGE
jgi:hypothetical protein